MPSGRQATGANTTPLGALNPAFMGQGIRPTGGGGGLLLIFLLRIFLYLN